MASVSDLQAYLHMMAPQPVYNVAPQMDAAAFATALRQMFGSADGSSLRVSNQIQPAP